MKKPYIICHMMTSVDGRIDCAMTSQLSGVEDYYKTLAELNLPSTLSGRVTAETEMAEEGFFKVKNKTPLGKEEFAKNQTSSEYEIITDTDGKLMWQNIDDNKKPYLIITSEHVTKEYLDYLNHKNISWIACGKDKINLKRAVEILYSEFDIKRLGIVGGPTINTAFLNANLLDEISLMIGPGIDARQKMPSVFDGRKNDFPLTHLKLKDIKKFNSGAVWLRYNIEQ